MVRSNFPLASALTKYNHCPAAGIKKIKLGTHTSGYALRTLDDIYKEAKDDWLLKRDHADTYFTANNKGMISSCGYVERGCQDDCFRGISIHFIEKI